MERDRALDHNGRPDIGRALDGLTDRIISKRVQVETGMIPMPDGENQVTVVANATPVRQRVEVLPPIQIKGLAADVLSVKRGFGDIREIVRDVNDVAAALKQDLSDVKDQLHQHRQDIRFEAEQLGNSGGNGGEGDK